MPPLCPISGRKLLKLLKAIGFEVVRIKGSHHFLYRQSDEKTTTVPIHGNEQIGIGLLRSILRDVKISVGEYDHLRKTGR